MSNSQENAREKTFAFVKPEAIAVNNLERT